MKAIIYLEAGFQGFIAYFLKHTSFCRWIDGLFLLLLKMTRYLSVCPKFNK